MKKLILVLLIVPLAGVCQTQSYKIKETTPSYQVNGERTYEVENTSNRSTYRNPQYIAPPTDNTAKVIQQTSQNFSNAISNIARNAAANSAANSNNKPLLNSNKKSLRGVELNSYKYIVIQEVNFNYYRKTAVKVLKKAGFNVVNLHKTSRTHKIIPSDLKQNPDLGLYLHLDVLGTFNIEAQARFFNYNNELLFNSSGGSSISNVRAVKNALSPFETYDYKYNPNIVRKKQTYPVESTSVDIENSSKEEAINEVKQLKELLDSGILTQEEFDKKAAELKKIILGN
tara:strand:+ start:107 stop:964 length:858 start_codon:yes stop_codon:yes gene_type:complete